MGDVVLHELRDEHGEAIAVELDLVLGDTVAFYDSWEAGEGCADVNEDGGVDGEDVVRFFRLWEAGGC
jgi:hypothetical protein